MYCQRTYSLTDEYTSNVPFLSINYINRFTSGDENRIYVKSRVHFTNDDIL